VPKFIAAIYAFTYHKAHNITADQTPGYIPTDTVTIKRALHLGQVASTLNIPIETLRNLNPQYKLDIIPATRKSYTLRLPMRYISEFTTKEKVIYSKEKQYLKDYLDPASTIKKTTESTTKPTSSSSSTKPTSSSAKTTPKPAAKPSTTTSTTSKPKPTTTQSSYTYVVQEGDVLGRIAIRNNCTVDEIVKWNNLESADAIRIGQKLLIKRPKPKDEPKKWETISQVVKRSKPIMDKYFNLGYKKIAVVCHGGIIRRFTGEWQIDHCHIKSIEYTDDFTCFGWI
jgi:membrane-bound lytic murein transglycosylase D